MHRELLVSEAEMAVGSSLISTPQFDMLSRGSDRAIPHRPAPSKPLALHRSPTGFILVKAGWSLL